MTKEDEIIFDDFIKTKCKNLYNKNIVIHSAWEQQINVLSKYFSCFKNITINDWDITVPANFKTDVLVFCNVLMYLKTPDIVFENIFNCCEYVIIQDIINRNRGEDIFGSDGDSMRYSYSPNFMSKYENAFDLAKYNDKILFFQHYKDNYINDHFILLMKS